MLVGDDNLVPLIQTNETEDGAGAGGLASSRLVDRL